MSDGIDSNEPRNCIHGGLDGLLNEPGPILFVSDEGAAGRSLFSMQPDGSDVRQLTAQEKDYWITDAVWSPDGKRILIREYGPGGGYGGPGPRPTPPPPPVVYVAKSNGRAIWTCPLEGYPNERFVWSPDSDEFIHGHGDGEYSYLVDARPEFGRPYGPKYRSYPKPYYTIITDWGQDDRTLLGYTRVLLRDLKPITKDIGIAFWTTKGDSIAAIGISSTHLVQPIWSHNQERIAVTSRVADSTRLFRISSNGTDALQLTNDDYSKVYPVAWSPNDSHILTEAYHVASSTPRILIVDAETGEIDDITPFSGERSYPTSWRAY